VHLRDSLKTERVLNPEGCKIGVNQKVKVTDRNKRITIINDLCSKDDFLIELLADKENIDKQLACFANVPFMHNTFKEVQQSIKDDTSRFRSDLKRIKNLIKECKRFDFKESNSAWKKAAASLKALLHLKSQYKIKLELYSKCTEE